MNKRDREQLQASIPKDLVQGQGENSATRELLRQYAPLQGVVSQPSSRNSVPSGIPQPEGNSMAPRATVAQKPTLARNTDVALQTTVESDATLAHGANNKEKLDDDLKRKSSSKCGSAIASFENATGHHKGAAAPAERHANAGSDLALIRAAYERATGNRWSKSDTEAYQTNGLKAIPTSKIVSTLETLSQRTPARINSFNYFVKEIMATPDPRNRAWRKKRLERIVGRVRDRYVDADRSAIDFLEDVKCACAQVDVEFDNDLCSELVG
jgi:hypothetical protein